MIAHVEADHTATGSTTDLLNGGFAQNVIELQSGGFRYAAIRTSETHVVGTQASAEKRITAKSTVWSTRHPRMVMAALNAKAIDEGGGMRRNQQIVAR